LILPDEKISMGWVFVSGRVQGTFGYLGVGVHGILDCCWYKWQAVLLHTDQKCQAFVVVSNWTVYCIVLWVFLIIFLTGVHVISRLNVDTWSILVFVHSVAWEWMLSWWVVFNQILCMHMHLHSLKGSSHELEIVLRSRMDSCCSSYHSVLHPHNTLNEMSIDEDSHSYVTSCQPING
jgi:hypothetical protein